MEVLEKYKNALLQPFEIIDLLVHFYYNIDRQLYISIFKDKEIYLKIDR